MTHAPYRGAAPAFIDLIPGRIDCYFGSGELLTYSRSGQVRALGTTGSTSERRRSRNCRPSPRPAFPVTWSIPGRACFVPAKTPPEIVKKMSADIVAALADPAIADKLARSAYTARGSSPEELRDFLKADAEKWSAVIKTAGLKID